MDHQPNLFTRDDTFFGVCQALGEDLRIPPNLLRMALALSLFWNPLAALCSYAAAGILVALTRWLVPNPRLPVAAAEAAGRAPSETIAATAEAEPLPLAA